LKAIYDELVNKKVNFIDKKFPPKLSTIGDDSRIDTDMRSAVWLRPNQLFNSNYEQGSLGVCYYLSTISALAER
jgi:hypothetical protein